MPPRVQRPKKIRKRRLKEKGGFIGAGSTSNATATDNTNATKLMSGDMHLPNRGTIFINAYKDKHQPASKAPSDD
jgi:hypothetical protein